MISLDPLYQTLKDNPHDDFNWLKLGLALLTLGWREQLGHLCQIRQDQFGDGPTLLFNILNHASSPLHRKRIFEMSDSAPQGTILAVIYDYFAGCHALLDDNPEKGFRLLRRAAVIGRKYSDILTQDDRLSNILIQHLLIRPPEEVDKIDLSWPKNDLPSLEWGKSSLQHQGKTEGPILMACCNDTYHHRFGREFIETLSPFGHIHIHVANASPEMKEVLETDAAGKRLSYSFEDSGSFGIGHYYAVMRFLNAPSIMEFFDTDLAILDIDCEAVKNLPDLLSQSQQSDVSYFRTGDPMPWLDHHAAYVYLSNSPGGKAYAERLRAYIASKLAKACWMLDQSSMCSLFNFYLRNGFKDGDTEIKLTPFKRSDGHNFWNYFTPSGTPEEKWEYRFQKNES